MSFVWIDVFLVMGGNACPMIQEVLWEARAANLNILKEAVTHKYMRYPPDELVLQK